MFVRRHLTKERKQKLQIWRERYLRHQKDVALAQPMQRHHIRLDIALCGQWHWYEFACGRPPSTTDRGYCCT